MPDKTSEARHFTTFLITALFVGLFLGLFNSSFAQITVCNQQSLFLSSQANILWGNPGIPGQVQATPGSQVRLSVSGENVCVGQSVRFTISGTSNTFLGTLSLGQQISSNLYQLYYDWTNNLSNGTYRFNVFSPSFGISAGPSANELVVGALQQCNIARVYASPNGGVQGDAIQLIVEGQGTCQNWGATANVVNATGGGNTVVWSGSQQTFTSSNTLSWSYTLPSVAAGAGQGVYYINGNLGGQTIRSSNFIVCINQSSCSVGGIPPTPVQPGQDQNLIWNITNPLRLLPNGAQPRNVFDVIILITDWILNIAGSLIIILIIYGGVMFLISAGNPGKIQQAKNILKWALIGFMVVLIGKGFVYLVQDVLQGQMPIF